MGIFTHPPGCECSWCARIQDAATPEAHTITEFVALAETPMAWQLLIDDEEVWVPKSQILAGDPSVDSEIEVAYWLAEKKGLVGG